MTEIGLGLTGFGVFFSILGIIFFFDKGLLAMGNVSKDAHSVLDFILGDVDDRIEIYHAILHETTKLQGYILIWLGLCLGPYRMAYLGDDIGGIRFHCAVQWLLAYIGSFPTKDTNPWLDLPAAVCDIGTGAEECLCEVDLLKPWEYEKP
ncbi:hypothetical protein Syun_018807 [Stephania yunnanensis]|uniref:Uncharacterized protein n=1 Tax=Stephania yunnanensis TaxID=152371 RepID=A0AAP0ITK8_9MAGN